MSNEKLKITDTILVTDEPTLAGSIYPKEVVEKALDNIQGQLPIVFHRDLPNDITTGVQLDVIVGMANVSLDGNNVVATMEIYNTPRGQLLKEFMEGGTTKFDFRTFGSGQTDPDGFADIRFIDEFTLCGISIHFPTLEPTQTKENNND